ncbi:MAG: anthranilate phosphoribosyltransferase [Sulfurifustis sp.]
MQTDGLASSDTELMRSILQRIATGPELSKNISREEAHQAMRLILDERVDPVQAGVFLIALRMKRETDDEMLGLLDALREATPAVTASVDELIDLGDPYDGFARTLPIAAFLPALLAACGVPAVSHGVESMGPKYGVTHRQVLRAAGLPIGLSVEDAAARLADPALGWAYIDQSAFCPKLYRLARLRSLIVKRPALTTVEVLLGPIRARRRTHLVTGFVHKAYPRVYALLARAARFDSALLVRGVEGGVIPSIRQEGKYFRYDRGEVEQEHRMTPADFGLTAPLLPLAAESGTDAKEISEEATIDNDAIARATVEAGRRALEGQPGAARENLVAAAALCLHHLGRHPTLGAAAAAVRVVLDSGDAARRLR